MRALWIVPIFLLTWLIVRTVAFAIHRRANPSCPLCKKEGDVL